MREAGFTGHSRGLKTMRDETTLINKIIGSIQQTRGCQKAGVLYHVIFGTFGETCLSVLLGSER